ncbi:MAG: hypothetical protein IPO91_07575 [Chloroflexi bacterium]|nr:hypothetical protein [Chloroflexota bacterium]
MSDKRQQALNVTVDDLIKARHYFGGGEGGEWHYQTMRALVDPVLDALLGDDIPDDLTSFRIHWMFAVSAWNKKSYQSNSRDPLDHFRRIEAPLRTHWTSLMGYRRRNILSLSEADREVVETIFDEFSFLGPVGRAKGLHLFAPEFFCPWDTKIYKGYGFAGDKTSYWQFLRQTQAQIERLSGCFGDENPIKAIDRFNFWHFTRDRDEK